MIETPCQRWRVHRDSYRPAAEPIDPSRYGVELIAGDDTARDFVELHHYSGSYPAARLRAGLYRVRPGGGTELVGVAVFSVPPSEAVIPKWTRQGPRAGVELGRLVLLDEVEGNGETWFLARALRLLAAELPEVSAVLSFSDPVSRRTLDGQVVTPGHVGTIYQALNGRHVGRSEARWRYLAGDGRDVTKPLLDKIRYDKKGRDYAAAQLVAWGAPARAPGELGGAYVDRALRDGPFRRYRHPGNLAYVWPVGTRRTAPKIAQGFPAALAYPKLEARVHSPAGSMA